MSPISRGHAPRIVFLSWHINKVSIYLSAVFSCDNQVYHLPFLQVSLKIGSSSVLCDYNAPSVKRIGVTSPKVISVAMGGLTIKMAYDRICLEDLFQTCFGGVVGVWRRRGSIGFLIFYGSKFTVGWLGCHLGCHELRKYNRVLQLSKMSKNCINAFKKQNSDNT